MSSVNSFISISNTVTNTSTEASATNPVLRLQPVWIQIISFDIIYAQAHLTPQRPPPPPKKRRAHSPLTDDIRVSNELERKEKEGEAV